MEPLCDRVDVRRDMEVIHSAAHFEYQLVRELTMEFDTPDNQRALEQARERYWIMDEAMRMEE